MVRLTPVSNVRSYDWTSFLTYKMEGHGDEGVLVGREVTEEVKEDP